jgi:hypothetical protein
MAPDESRPMKLLALVIAALILVPFGAAVTLLALGHTFAGLVILGVLAMGAVVFCAVAWLSTRRDPPAPGEYVVRESQHF